MNWLFFKKKPQTTETPQNNNNIKKPQECGLSLRHLITGALTNLERVQRQASGKKKKAIRGVKLPSEGGWGLRKSQG